VKRYSEIYLTPDAFHKLQQEIDKRKEDRDKTVNDYIKQFVREF